MPVLQSQLEAALHALGKDSSKLVAITASGSENMAFDLTLEVCSATGQPVSPGSPTASHVRLSWTERIVGDYDFNGEVNLADLVPLSRFLRRSVSYDQPELHAGFAAWPSGSPNAVPLGNPPANNWHLARVDGDSNGEINAADILPIARHWGEQLDGYVIERGINRGTGVMNWERLDASSGSNFAGAVLRSFDPAAGRSVLYSLLLPISEAHFAQSFRVRGWSYASGNAPVASPEVHYLPDAVNDLAPPIWDEMPGAQLLVPDDQQLTVFFGTASDAQSPPVRYRVFWQAVESDADPQQFDFNLAYWADTFQQSHVISGLDNSQHYQVAVRAIDNAVPSNMEQNRVVLGRKPGPRDVYPPVWPSGQTGIANLFFGNGTVIVSWPEAFDHTEDEFGVWSSGPPNYRLYYGTGTEPNLSEASVIKIASNGSPFYVRSLDGLDTARPHWFMVRATDRAEFPNLETNSHYLVGWPSTSRVIQAGLPGIGPGVPQGATRLPQPRFAFTADRKIARLCIQSYTSTERWISLYEVSSSGFSHSGDYHFANVIDDPHYKFITIGLDANLQPLVLHTRSRTLGGPHVLVEYHGADGHKQVHSVENGADLLSAEYGPDGRLHAFWMALEDLNLEDLKVTSWYSGLPFSAEEAIHASHTDPENRYLTMPPYEWCWLEDGGVAVQTELVSLNSGDRSQRILFLREDGSVTFLPCLFRCFPVAMPICD
jgi:hypothetical protein